MTFLSYTIILASIIHNDNHYGFNAAQHVMFWVQLFIWRYSPIYE